MKQGSSMPSGIPEENLVPKDESETLTLSEAFEKLLDRPKTNREQQAFDVITGIESGDDEVCQGMVGLIQNEQASLKDRFETLDILLLASFFIRYIRREHLDKIRGYVFEATRIHKETNFIVGMTFEYVAQVNGLDTHLEIHNPRMESPLIRARVPLDMITKKPYDQIDEGDDSGMFFLEIPNEYAAVGKKFHVNIVHEKACRFRVITEDDKTDARQAIEGYWNADGRIRSVLEEVGEYIPVAEFQELQHLLQQKGVFLTTEEYQVINQSWFMEYTELVFGLDWRSLTLREQVYALSYLKSIKYQSEEGGVAERYLKEMGNNGLASFQVVAGDFEDPLTMMRILGSGRDFEKKILATFRSLASAADQIQNILTTQDILSLEENLPSDADVQKLRDIMLRKGINLLNKYLKLFIVPPAVDEDNLTEAELLDRVPIELGGNMYTPFTAKRLMEQEIESVRVDAEVYAEFIIQQYRENPESIHEVLRTDFRTLTPEEIETLEQRFIATYKANRERYISDELELAASILRFREKLNRMKTDPLCPIHLQTFTFKGELIGFSTVEHIGNPEDKRIHITSFSLEPDVQDQIVGHAHIQKIMFDVYDDYTVEGEVHRDNRKLLNMYVKRYGFMVTGTTMIDGKEFTTILRLPKGEKKEQIIT
jgi:hypothetical protein